MGKHEIIPEKTGYGYELFIEGFSGRSFYSSKEAVLRAERRLNESFQIRGYAYLNDFYSYLGISKTEIGMHLGWCAVPNVELIGQEIEFDHIMTDINITTIEYEIGYVIKYPITPLYETFT